MLRLQIILKSWFSLPVWVQIWIGLILVPVNALPFFYRELCSAHIAAGAALLVLLLNLPIALWEQGFGKLMAIPHVLILGPLQIVLVLRIVNFVGEDTPSAAEINLIVLLLVVNGISLIFDLFDSWRWFRGERGVAGRL
jgi:hypothetical protein